MTYSLLFYSFLLWSIPLATLVPFEIASNDVRPWVLTLILCFIQFFFVARKPINVSTLSLSSLFLALALFLSVLVHPASEAVLISRLTLLTAFYLLYLVSASIPINLFHDIIVVSIILPAALVCVFSLFEYFFFSSSLQTYYSTTSILPRARGFFAEANEFSQYLGIPFSFIISYLFFPKYSPFPRYILLLFLILITLSQILTLSRGGLLVFFVNLSVGSFLAFYYYKLRHFQFQINLPILSTFFVSILIVSALLINPSFSSFLLPTLERLNSLFSGSDATSLIRFESQADGFSFIQNNFFNLFFGIGFGRLPIILGPNAATTSNFFADVLIESGIIGFAFLLFFLLSTTLAVFRSFRLVETDSSYCPILFALSMSFFGLVVGGTTYATLLLNFFWLVAGLIFALLSFLSSRGVVLSHISSRPYMSQSKSV